MNVFFRNVYLVHHNLVFLAAELRPRTLQLYPHENKHAHHTEDYDEEEFVLRRGQDFDMAVTFDRPYDKDTDTIGAAVHNW